MVISRDHHDVSGTDSPFRETSNVYDGSAFCAGALVLLGSDWMGSGATEPLRKDPFIGSEQIIYSICPVVVLLW